MKNINDWPALDKGKLFSFLGDNALKSAKYKLLYVATPKVACTSLKWWFAELEGYTKQLCEITDSAETDPDLIIHDSFYKVAPSVTGLLPDALLEPLTSDDYFRFAVVRNPYKRIFSAWQSKLLLREPLQIAPYINCGFYNQTIENAADVAKTFEGFLEHLAANEVPNFLDVHWTPQADLLRPDLISYSKLVKIENAKELSAALSEWLGVEFVDPFATRRTNESLIPYLPELITARSAELIRLLYARDFATFGYDEEIPPAKETFSTEQFRLAIKAIEMIRARHQRMGDMGATFVNQAKVVDEQAKVIEEQAKVADEQAKVIEEQAKVADEQAKVIEEQAKVADEQAKVIEEIYASSSWRLTRPLRFFKRLLQR
jgi:Sulfotransferase family